MKKWAVIFVFVVSWPVKPMQQVVPCPDAQKTVYKEMSREFVPACIETRSEDFMEKPTKKEAQKFADSIELLLNVKTKIIEKK